MEIKKIKKKEMIKKMKKQNMKLKLKKKLDKQI